METKAIHKGTYCPFVQGQKRGTPERMPQTFNQKMPPIAGGLLLAS